MNYSYLDQNVFPIFFFLNQNVFMKPLKWIFWF